MTLTPGLFNFGDADFSGVALTAGNVYTPRSIDLSGRWFIYTGFDHNIFFRALNSPATPLPQAPPPPVYVPDGGTTAGMLGISIIGLAALGRRRSDG